MGDGKSRTPTGVRPYVLLNRLEYDAKKVKIAALTRTTGKPDARPGVTEELRVVQA